MRFVVADAHATAPDWWHVQGSRERKPWSHLILVQRLTAEQGRDAGVRRWVTGYVEENAKAVQMAGYDPRVSQ